MPPNLPDRQDLSGHDMQSPHTNPYPLKSTAINGFKFAIDILGSGASSSSGWLIQNSTIPLIQKSLP